MNYYIYLSRATQAMSEDDLNKLIEGCIEYNSQNDITGLLMYKGPLSSEGDAYFMQLLEGPGAKIEDLKKKILVDGRHKDVVMLEEGDLTRRTFPTWSMGLRHVEDFNISSADGCTNLNAPELWEQAQKGDLDKNISVMQFFSDEDV